jgi:large conductance mechanosensitive channel
MARSGRVGGFFGEFKEFLSQGNVVDLAVAVIIGAAFGKIIESLMTDIITPVILSPALKATGVENLAEFRPGGVAVGLFLAAVLNFVVVAFVIFVLIKSLQEAKRRTAREEALAEPEVDVQTQLVESINRLNETIANKL